MTKRAQGAVRLEKARGAAHRLGGWTWCERSSPGNGRARFRTAEGFASFVRGSVSGPQDLEILHGPNAGQVVSRLEDLQVLPYFHKVPVFAADRDVLNPIVVEFSNGVTHTCSRPIAKG